MPIDTTDFAQLAGIVPTVQTPLLSRRMPPLQPMGLTYGGAGLDPGPAPAQVKEADLDITQTVSPEALNRYGFMTYRWTDDPLLLDKGWGALDDQMTYSFVSAPTRLKKYTCFYKEWQVTPMVRGMVASERAHGAAAYDKACQRADMCRYVLQNIYDPQTGQRQDIRRVLWEVADAWHYGFSVTEKEHRILTSGQYKGLRGYSRMVPRRPGNIRFRIDPYSNRVMDVINYAAPYGYQPYLPVRKFVIYTYQPFAGLPYGKGDGRVNHKHVWAVSDLIRQWMVALQKHGAGFLKVVDPVGTPEHLQQTHDKLVELTSSGILVFPRGYEAEMMALPQNVLDSFMHGIEWHSSQCALNILGQKLTTMEGTGKGTFALASIHADTQEYFVNHVRKDIETDVVRHQMLAPLCEMNFGDEDMEYVPSFSLGVWNHQDTKIIAEYITELVQWGIVHPAEPWLKDRLEIPPSLVDVPTVSSPDNLVLLPGREYNQNNPDGGNAATAN